MRFAAVCALTVVASTASALAYTQQDADACTPDAFRLCSAYIPNEQAIEACLRASRSQLSAACAAVFGPASKNRDARQTKRPARQ